MRYLQVKNWEVYQHYTDRNPPWIKLHNSLLDDFDFMSLEDELKWQLIAIWLLASRMQNRIPYDETWIAMKTGIKVDKHTKPQIELFISLGFLTMYQDASDTLAGCKQDASPRALAREESETETETEKIETGVPVSCSATSSTKRGTLPAEPAVLVFPCSGKIKSWNLTQHIIDDFHAAYPALDILGECRMALAWIKTNNPKTAKGMLRFLNGWLARSNNRTRNGNGKHEKPTGPVYRPSDDPELKEEIEEINRVMGDRQNADH